ncbi:hypothetical protein MMC30_007318 [Trapelia coarctata]|nr:hypothetical protein [Trapelia coarctata]
MKSVTFIAGFAASLLTTGVHALELIKRDGPPAVVALPIEKREGIASVLQRRATVAQTLDNFMQVLYFANVTIGTPPQTFRFHIDTGSSDLWSNAAASRLCRQTKSVDPQTGALPCSVSGTYNANASSTYKYIDSGFSIRYADTTGASGDYVSDILNIGGVSVNPLQFGVGYNSNSSEGVMGIGYPSLEVAVQVQGDSPYPNIPQAMAKQGLIQSPAYSLWLDDLNSATGSILFGGVDTDKYIGSLATLPIVKEQGVYVEMIVAMTGITLAANNANTTITSKTYPVLLDSGSTLSYLPTSVVAKLYSALGVEFSQQYAAPFCQCSLANTSATVDFSFGGKIIAVPMSEMVLSADGTTVQSSTGQTLDCIFGIFAESSSGGSGTAYTLGDTFIRSAYIVYDLANNEISLASTNFQATKSNIMEIGKGANSVPDAQGVAAPSVTVTGTAVIGASGTGVNPTSTATSTSAAGATKQTPLGAWVAVGAAALLFAS